MFWYSHINFLLLYLLCETSLSFIQEILNSILRHHHTSSSSKILNFKKNIQRESGGGGDNGDKIEVISLVAWPACSLLTLKNYF